MAVPRPLLLTLLGTVLLAATFAAAHSSKSVSQKTAAPMARAQPKQAAPAAPAKPATLAAQDVVRALVSPGKPIASARVNFRLSAVELGGKHQRQALVVKGRFGPGSGGLPNFDARSGDSTERAHVAAVAGQGYGYSGGKAYKLAATAPRVAAIRKILAGDKSAATLPAVDPAPWFKHLKTKPAKVDGVEATHVTGAVNSKKLAKDVRHLAKAAGAASQLPAPLPKGFGKALQQTFSGARLDAYVGNADKTVRRLHLVKSGPLPAMLLSKGDSGRWRVTLDLSLAQVNKPQKIAAPARPSRESALPRRRARAADNSFTTLAVALDPPAGLTQMTATYLRSLGVARARRIPRKVEAAVARHEKVVLFIFQRNGVDDRSTAHAVASLHKRTKAVVFADSIDNLASYGQVVQSVGVTRAPSVVIISRKGRARLVDGYIDPASLAQEVRDTR